MQEIIRPGIDLRKNMEPLSDKIYRLLEDNILTASYPPGMNLNECDLAEMLNVSRSPVREALFRLESAGLAKKTKKGRVVAEIDLESLRYNYQLWQMTEPYGAGLACQRYNDQDLYEITDALNRMTQYTSVGDYENYRKMNYEFHSCLVKPCGNPLLVTMHRDVLNRIKWASHYSLEISEDIDSSAVSHARILAAYTQRDSALVKSLLEDHILDAAKRLISKYPKS